MMTFEMISNPVPWPAGSRGAASVSFDVDLDSMLELEHGEHARQRMAGRSWLRYDEVAVPRLLRLYRELGIKQTFFFPGWCIENYAYLVEACVEGGHEIALHGYQHEVINRLAPGEEERLLDRTIAAAEALLAGVIPTGWRSPLYSLSQDTPRLLVERGFTYDASLMGDDVPYILRSSAGDLLELPSEWANDDWSHYAVAPDLDYATQVRSPSEAAGVYRAELESARRHGALWIAVWHPNVSGRMARFEVVADILTELAQGPMWLAPLGTIAGYVNDRIADGSFNPRVDLLRT
ncbi:polysaccharide deacetylase family protein [Arthrobacter sp. NicSoilB8]|uniref:polysaccharide deacetylase family protein n=1 Tax=Arthrobacter sp. NicSoilB8 TaxID=2830998 RepID=UPI001CC36709|nr:polysaccharide deacetylase family protein [Arthrobacter sp. NicSoilB8]